MGSRKAWEMVTEYFCVENITWSEVIYPVGNEYCIWTCENTEGNASALRFMMHEWAEKGAFNKIGDEVWCSHQGITGREKTRHQMGYGIEKPVWLVSLSESDSYAD